MTGRCFVCDRPIERGQSRRTQTAGGHQAVACECGRPARVEYQCCGRVRLLAEPVNAVGGDPLWVQEPTPCTATDDCGSGASWTPVVLACECGRYPKLVAPASGTAPVQRIRVCQDCDDAA